MQEIDLSHTSLTIEHYYIKDGVTTHLTAKGITFAARNLYNLLYLDLEGSTIKDPYVNSKNRVEYLNLAGTNFRSFYQLPDFPHLKKLVIDKSTTMEKTILQKLKEKSVEIVVRE